MYLLCTLFLYGEVCNVLNDFYINIAKEIGIENQSYVNKSHPSIEAIKQNGPEEGYANFDFKPVTQSHVIKVIKDLNPKKATGNSSQNNKSRCCGVSWSH